VGVLFLYSCHPLVDSFVKRPLTYYSLTWLPTMKQAFGLVPKVGLLGKGGRTLLKGMLGMPQLTLAPCFFEAYSVVARAKLLSAILRTGWCHLRLWPDCLLRLPQTTRATGKRCAKTPTLAGDLLGYCLRVLWTGDLAAWRHGLYLPSYKGHPARALQKEACHNMNSLSRKGGGQAPGQAGLVRHARCPRRALPRQCWALCRSRQTCLHTLHTTISPLPTAVADYPAPTWPHYTTPPGSSALLSALPHDLALCRWPDRTLVTAGCLPRYGTPAATPTPPQPRWCSLPHRIAHRGIRRQRAAYLRGAAGGMI